MQNIQTKSKGERYLNCLERGIKFTELSLTIFPVMSIANIRTIIGN